MNWTSVKGSYGFQRPFNFTVAIPFLLNACGLALVIVACLILLSNGSLTVGTQRFYFFSYICVALITAALLSRVATSAAYAIFIWCVVEVVIGVVTNVIETRGVVVSYLPSNLFTEQSDPRFAYHPLLQRVPRPNVHWVAADLVFQQNSLALRGIEPSVEDMKKDLIFVYGGSTTYDLAVTQGSTWVERMQADLHGRYTILNFGVPSYSTTENLIQTAFYQGIVGKRPVCAVYYEGWNDIHNAHITDLDRAYADFHLPLIAIRSSNPYFAKYSPLIRLFSEAARSRLCLFSKHVKSLPVQRERVKAGEGVKRNRGASL